MKHLYFFLCFLSFWGMSAQQRLFQLEWQGEINVAVVPGDEIKVPSFRGANFVYANGSILFVAQWKGKVMASTVQLANVRYESLSENNLGDLQKEKIPQKPNLQITQAKARDQDYVVLEISPIVQTSEGYKKIVSFTVNYSTAFRPVNSVNAIQTAPSPSHSIFSEGNWFRFFIPKTGVYRISKDFLANLGMDVNAIDPKKLKIYGHEGNMLPLINEKNTNFDPPQISIEVVGGEDGSFDSGDYILFYGKAVDDHWSEENQTNLNLYANRSYYYITADGTAGTRIGSYAEPTGNATTTFISFWEQKFYEKDLYSIAKTGRRWFGDRFDVNNQKTYDFTFENRIESTPLKLEVAAAASSEIATNMEVSVNRQAVGTLNFGSITTDVFGRDAFLSLNNLSVSKDKLSIKLNYNNGGNPTSLGYLDYVSVEAERELRGTEKQFVFAKPVTTKLSGVGRYTLSNAEGISEIWDITNPSTVQKIENQEGNAELSFKAKLGEVRKYVGVVPSDYFTPLSENKASVTNQDLKGTIFLNEQGKSEEVDYLIITTSALQNQAHRLAQHRKETDGLKAKVVLAKRIYQEFNSGKQDIGALRNFIRYVYENSPDRRHRLKYVCLLGDASVDYKDRLDRNNNILPTYESLYSFSLGSSTTASDDFFGMMDPKEGSMVASDKLDLAVGRILADSPQLAKTKIDKILAYDSKKSYGRWRNNFVLIADDADVSGPAGYGLQEELDLIADSISANKPFINVEKIYSDACQQTSSAGGFRYPKVNQAITDAVEVGASVVNYFGHGGENGLASEQIVTVNDIRGWSNENKYNVLVTVTCEFTRFDNPLRISLGEVNLANPKGGSVALVSTTRTISVSTGADFNAVFGPYLFNYDGSDDSIAESVRKAKNEIARKDRRVVFYFGDPALKLALPDPQVELTSINDIPINQARDTLKALGRVRIKGEVVDASGNLFSNYNGELSSTIFDKRIDRNTLNNDGNGVFNFNTLGNIIFRGKASVKKGLFSYDFVVPKDISLPIGEGRISFYAEKSGQLQDQKGYSNAILVGGINEDAPEDNTGPEIQLYMNDENFVSGGTTNASPFILAKLTDENGINTAGGIGHDLVVIIDGDKTNPIVVNDYYETETDNYKKGSVNYRLRNLDKGLHTLTFKAWDVYNNSNTAELQFVVADEEKLTIDHVLNYPNPFHDYTEFWFNHNRSFESLKVQVQVFTVSGKIVWTHNQVINTEGFLSREIT